MAKWNRFYGPALFGLILVPLTQACDGENNPLCCTEFEVGGNITANIGGTAQSQVAVQAVADFAAIASAGLEDITTACRSMAQELDAPKADQDAAEANADKSAKLTAWCNLAVKQIGAFKAKAQGTLTVVFVPPKCSASIQAKANCQAKCSVDGKCDIKANPPKCTGGRLEVACKGECTAKAGATLRCEGKCSASCKGSCTASAGGVQCAGKCNGTCKGAAQGGTGEGITANGTCNGTCEGTCEVVAPNVTCNGSCNGECSGSCTGSAEASVTCDGECKADYEPLKCEGGKLEGGCQVDAKCDANCDASVRAKAECTPPSVTVTFAGAANIEAAGKLRAVFEANLGVILAYQQRLSAMFEIAGSFTANIQGVVDIKAACIPPVLNAVKSAAAEIDVSVKACASIAGTTK
jgi:hypothetical protein